jgi:phosphate transport system permease protein
MTSEPEEGAGASRKYPVRSRIVAKTGETFVRLLLNLFALFTILVTVAILGIVFGQAYEFFGLPKSRDVAADSTADVPRVTVREFVTAGTWSQMGREPTYGIWPLICGTFLVTAIAMVVAVPLGLVTAIYLAEYAPRTLRNLLKPTLELLAGIPTVVYGFFAVAFISQGIRTIDDALTFVTLGFDTYNAFSAGVAVGILCLPTVASLAEDALHAVPRALREGSYGLGATKFETSLRVVFPAALSGIVSAVLLAVARAVGETMIVALAAGATPRMTLDPRDQIQTMTGYIAQIATGDVSNFGVDYYSLYAVAATLFLITMSLTLLGNYVRRRFQEAYQ